MLAIGERIKKIRTDNDLTQEEFARRLRKNCNLKVDRVTVSKWETGFQEPTIKPLSCIASIFNVSLDYLTGATDERTP